MTGTLTKPTRTTATIKAAPVATQPDPLYSKLLKVFTRVCRSYYKNGKGVPFTLQWRNGEPTLFGEGEPAFALILKDRTGISMVASLDGTAFLEAYVYGHMDFKGSMEKMFSFRDMTTDNHLLQYAWNLIKPMLFGQIKTDRTGISSHYDFPQDFYLSFLDKRHRCYSQAVFNKDHESLEDAMTRKLDFALEAIQVRPGDRVLDIGGGWGAFNEHAGKNGIKVTSVTISDESEKFLNKIIKEENLPCEVVNRHLYEFHPREKFDAIVNLGVTEHLPDYGRSLAVYQRLLKPGGRIYLDASASRQKYKFHKFIYKHIYPGNCSPMCLHDYLTQLAKTPFRLLGVWDDRHSYYLTAKHWVQTLEKNRSLAVAFGGEETFRKFQIYLHGTADVFRRDIMQAYRLVLELPRTVL